MPKPKSFNTFRRIMPRAIARDALPMTASAADDERDLLLEGLRRMAIAGAHQPIALSPLLGGVSSDIYKASVGSRTVCIKRALPTLKVAADWQAPIERNRFEVEWMRVAGAVVPDAVPAILADDPRSGSFAMAWLAPDRHPVWKALLRDATIDTGTASAVG